MLLHPTEGDFQTLLDLASAAQVNSARPQLYASASGTSVEADNSLELFNNLSRALSSTKETTKPRSMNHSHTFDRGRQNESGEYLFPF